MVPYVVVLHFIMENRARLGPWFLDLPVEVNRLLVTRTMGAADQVEAIRRLVVGAYN